MTRAARASDGAGLVIAGMAVAWTLFGAAAGRPWPTISGFALATAAVAAGRLATERLSLVAGAGLAVAVWASHLLVPGWSGYPNADGALAVQGILAGWLLTSVPGGRWPRAIGIVVVLVATVELADSKSVFGFASLVLGVTIALLASRVGWDRRGSLAVFALLCALVGWTAVQTPETYRDIDTIAVRVQLWDEAIRLTEEHPVRGVGPGRFEAVQQATDDEDVRFAHSAPLQHGAEQGLPGLALLVLVTAWGLFRLADGPRSLTRGIGLGALAALAAHACVDFIVHFPLVFATTAVLVGIGSSRQEDLAANER